MVGVPTSNRCGTCKIRKKKCGEQRPSCAECIQSGWKCPGYQAHWKFVDEVPQLAKRYARRKYVYDDATTSSADGAEEAKYDRELAIWKKKTVPRSPNHNTLGSEMIYHSRTNAKGKLVPLLLFGSFFDFIPARLGTSIALDDAVKCLCSVYSRARPSPNELPRGVYRQYLAAVTSLRKCVEDPTLRMESETLCASILLQICELAISDSRGKWSHLLDGSSTLIRTHGVKRYQHPFERAMLESQISFIFGQAMRHDQACFLESPEWRNLLSRKVEWPFHSTQAPSLTLRAQLIGILLDLPSLIVAARDPTLMSGEKHSDKLDSMIYDFHRLSVEVQHWLEFEAEPHFSTNRSLHVLSGEPITYPDILSAVLDCVAHKTLIVLDQALRMSIQVRSRLDEDHMLQVLPPNALLLNESAMVEMWHQRTVTAFKYVQGESELAAKPLDNMRRVEPLQMLVWHGR